MDPFLVEPFNLLMRYAAIVIPLATAVPALLAQFSTTSKSRNFMLIFWFVAPATLVVVTFECARLCFSYPTLPHPFFALLLATSVVLAWAYVRLAPHLLSHLQSRLEREELEHVREMQRDRVFAQLGRLLGGSRAEPTMSRGCLAVLRRALRSL